MAAVDVLLDMASALVEEVERIRWPGESLSSWYEGRLLGFELAAMRLGGADFGSSAAADFNALHVRCGAAFVASRARAAEYAVEAAHVGAV